MSQNSLTLESLALPQDLYWNGKMEPSSPPSSELFPITDSDESWLLNENFADDIFFVELKDVDIKINPVKFDDNHDTFTHEEEQIQELEIHIKKEPWSVKSSSSPQPMLDFGTFESVFHHPSMVTKVQNPYEVESCKSIYNNAAILTQLTPPQSPPQPVLTPPQSPPQDTQDVKEIFNYFSPQQVSVPQQQPPQQQQQHQHHASTVQGSPIPHVYQNISSPVAVAVPQSSVNAPSSLAYTPMVYNTTHSSDIVQNCQIVDEIVETRAKELSDWHDDNSVYNPYILASLSPAPQSIDEDWGRSSPSNSTSSQSSSSSVIGDSSSSSSDCGGKMQTSSSLAKKRTRPYGRGVEDRKNRKKEQNKNAATRYRQKKKQEMEVVLTEEQELSDVNKALQSTLAERKREAKYLKKLIREFYQNKNF